MFLFYRWKYNFNKLLSSLFDLHFSTSLSLARARWRGLELLARLLWPRRFFFGYIFLWLSRVYSFWEFLNVISGQNRVLTSVDGTLSRWIELELWVKQTSLMRWAHESTFCKKERKKEFIAGMRIYILTTYGCVNNKQTLTNDALSRALARQSAYCGVVRALSLSAVKHGKWNQK